MTGPAPVLARCCRPRTICPMAVSGGRPARSARTSGSSRSRVPGSGIEPVALLGDGEGDDLRGRCANPFHDPFRGVPAGDGFDDAGDDPQRGGAFAAFGHGEEAILRRQLAGHGIRALGDADDPPLRIVGSQHRVLGEDGGVGSGEGAKAEVDDPGLELVPLAGQVSGRWPPGRSCSGVR